ncbi:MAG TPA: 2-amino-4-hydroxy-6-hydroxymethyldihydropteridine diphosphokinase [Candidatus Nanopelagicaceae bacterium]|jgi:2-amino-4-hydroxy-6-hydroxymethyldihydropteridine diphosphokinase
MRAVVALGANLDNPVEAVELAISLLEQSTDLIARSSLYSTKPVGGPPQPDYVNAVCIIDSELPAHDLLDLLHGIEKSMGRVRNERWGPRVIDLDLITYGDVMSDDEDLILPHPRAHERRFVLEPWVEIDPDAELPLHGRVRDILAELPPSK